MASRLSSNAAWALLIASILAVSGLAAGLLAPVVQGADAPAGTAAAEEDDEEDEDDNPLGANAACYVCHMTFVKEDLARTHLAHEVGCIKCHGLSAAHANDEHIGATKPDIVYPRDKIDASCRQCHKEHDVPAQKVVARFLERKLPTASTPVCTDCHGTHKIQRAAASKDPGNSP